MLRNSQGAGIYRADLLRTIILQEAQQSTPAAAEERNRLDRGLAGHCGFQFTPLQISEPPSATDSAPEPEPLVVEPTPPPDQSPAPAGAEEDWRLPHLWTTTRHEKIDDPDPSDESARVPDDVPPLSDDDFRYSLSTRSGQQLLAWSKLWPFLKNVLGQAKSGRSVDLPEALRLIAAARPLTRLPRRPRKSWNPAACIYLDRRDGLAPFWDDYEDLLVRLRRLRGNAGIHIATLDIHPHTGEFIEETLSTRERQTRPLRLPPAGAAVLVLGDLRQYERHHGLTLPWIRLGRQLRRKGIVPWALCPCPPSRWSPRLASVWNLALWDRGQSPPRGAEGQRARSWPVAAIRNRQKDQVAHLLRRLSPCLRIERGLLRDVRFLSSQRKGDVSAEYDFFQAPEVDGGVTAVTPDRDVALKYRRLLPQLPDAELSALIRCIRDHHAEGPNLFWQMEVTGLADILPSDRWNALVDSGALSPEAQDHSRKFWRRFVRCLDPSTAENRDPSLIQSTAAFGLRNLDRYQQNARQRPEIQEAWGRAFAWTGLGPEAIPDWVSPEFIGDPAEGMTETWALTEHFGNLRLRPLPFPPTTGFGLIQSSRRIARLELPPDRGQRWIALSENVLNLQNAARFTLTTDLEVLEMKRIDRPEWATAFGRNRDEVWAERNHETRRCRFWRVPVEREVWKSVWKDEFGIAGCWLVDEVEFLFRWVPPGKFLMGSPESERGRDPDEGPQHEVTLTQGYWMAATPTTQEQWQAIMGPDNNPSESKGAKRPLENVSWDDAQEFIEKLNAVIPSLASALPTEAQWEYACRAGTNTAYHDGSDCTEPTGYDPALAPLGWFDKNSGNKTHDVAQKAPNAWGLFDCHGNVWEWCQDVWRDHYPDKPQTDPVHSGAEVQTDTGRVIRGGGTWSFARNCRSAFRLHGEPGNRGGVQGFRLVAGQSSEPEAKASFDAERRTRSSEEPAEQASGDEKNFLGRIFGSGT